MKRKLVKMFLVVFCLVCGLLCVSCVDTIGSSAKALSDVSDIQYSAVDSKIMWNSVDEAGSYEISINGGEVQTVAGTSYTYEANEQNFNVSLVAVPSDTENHTKSTKVEKTFTFLAKVNNINMSEGKLTWDPVPNANAYDVYLNGDWAGSVDGVCFYELTPNVSYLATILPKNDGNESSGYYGVKSNTFTGMVVAKPTLKFENKTTMIYWDAVDQAGGYKLLLSLNGKPLTSATFGSSTTSYVNSFVDAGVYTIQLQTISDKTRTDQYDSTFAEMEITRLPEVGAVQTSYPTTEANNTIFLSFDDIPGATGYEVREGNVTLKQQSKTTFEYTFNRSVDEVNTDLVIHTKGDGMRVLDSYTGKSVTLTKLAMPQDIQVNNGLIVWDAVNKCDGYRVLIDGVEYYANANQLEVPTLQPGAHKVSIAALGNNEMIVSSDFSNEMQIIKLQEPQNLRIQDNVLYWENVQYCESYQVQIDDLVQVVGTNSFAIDESYIGQNTTIKVRAISNGVNIITSNYSATKPLFRLSAPTNFKTTNDYISWAAVPNVDHYEVYFNNIIKSVKGESYSWEEFEAKEYIVRVVAVGDGSTYFTSTDSIALNIRKLAAPIVNIGDKEFVWSKVQLAKQYEILDQEEVHTTTELKYKPTYTTMGEKKLQFRSLGDCIETVASSWTEITHTVEQESLPGSFTVTRNGSEFTATIDTPQSGKTYLFNMSGTVKEGATSQSVVVSTAGSFTVSVAVKGDGFYTIDSTYSNSRKYTILSQVSSSTIKLNLEEDQYYTLTWDGVTNAAGYILKIQKTRADGTVEEEIVRNKTASQTSHGIDMTGYSSVKVTIIVKGNQVDTFDSVETVKSCPVY